MVLLAQSLKFRDLGLAYLGGSRSRFFMRLQVEFRLQSSECLFGTDGLTSRMAEGFSPYPHGTLECSCGMAAGSPRVSDPREESKEEATVPFMS